MSKGTHTGKQRAAVADDGTMILYVKLDRETTGLLNDFIAGQLITPTNAAVTVAALREFIANHKPKRGA